MSTVLDMYTKLFSSILDSSVWGESPEVCKVWVTLLAMMDREGYVFGSVAGIARRSVLPIEATQKALDVFLGPDPLSADLSRGSQTEGRRVEPAPGGWRIINAAYYRDLIDAEARRTVNREAKRRYRAKRRQPSAPTRVINCPGQSLNVLTSESYSESEAATEASPDQTRAPERAPPVVSEWPRTLRAGEAIGPKRLAIGQGLLQLEWDMEVWHRFVDHHIKVSYSFANESAVEAGWRNWCRNDRVRQRLEREKFRAFRDKQESAQADHKRPLPGNLMELAHARR